MRRPLAPPAPMQLRRLLPMPGRVTRWQLPLPGSIWRLLPLSLVTAPRVAHPVARRTPREPLMDRTRLQLLLMDRTPHPPPLTPATRLLWPLHPGSIWLQLLRLIAVTLLLLFPGIAMLPLPCLMARTPREELPMACTPREELPMARTPREELLIAPIPPQPPLIQATPHLWLLLPDSIWPQLPPRQATVLLDHPIPHQPPLMDHPTLHHLSPMDPTLHHRSPMDPTLHHRSPMDPTLPQPPLMLPTPPLWPPGRVMPLQLSPM